MATDKEGDKLSFTILNKPDWAEFDSTTGLLTGTPVLGSEGTFSNIRIEVSDGKEKASLAPFSIQVQAKMHQVTFIDAAGVNLSIQQIKHGSAANAPTVPLRTGFTFTGWSTRFNQVTSALTVQAQYSQNVYAVSFVDAEGKLLSTQQITHGQAATAPVAPVRKVLPSVAGMSVLPRLLRR